MDAGKGEAPSGCMCPDFCLVRHQCRFGFGMAHSLPLRRCILPWKSGRPPSAKWSSEMGKSETSVTCLGNIKDIYALNAVPRNCFVVEVFCLFNFNKVFILFW